MTAPFFGEGRPMQRPISELLAAYERDDEKVADKSFQHYYDLAWQAARRHIKSIQRTVGASDIASMSLKSVMSDLEKGKLEGSERFKARLLSIVKNKAISA